MKWVERLWHILLQTECQWEHRTDPGEEEHGKNFAKRYCKICGKVQYAFYYPYGDVRIKWEDL